MNNNNNSGQVKRAAPRGTALDPKNPSLVQPYKRLVDEGFITELIVKFTPTGVAAVGKPDKRLAGVVDSGLTEGIETPLGILASVADKGDLIPIKGKKGKKTEQPKPEKSLDKKDFSGTVEELFGRARAVATKCGGATLVGRVRSAERFDGAATISFRNWWASANPMDRAVALTTTKKLEELSREDIAKLGEISCPFTGAAEFTVSTQEQTAA